MRKTSVIFVCALCLVLSSGVRASDQQVTSKLSKLPLAAQSSISAALGRDLPDYYANPSGEGFEAAIPSQELAAHFDSAGVEVRSRNLRWRLAFDGYGYGDILQGTKMTSPRAAFNRIEYRHGPVTEWYMNGPAGLEQGFTVNQPPARADSQPLTIRLKLSGDLAAQLEPGGTALTLGASSGHAELRYSGLVASDAAGKQLRAWLEIRSATLLLKINSAGARYPVTIDPLVQKAKLTARDGAANDHFGNSVSIDGDTVVVGSPSAMIGSNPFQGAAYVFVKPMSGWKSITQTAKLIASDGAASDTLGRSVAVSGGTIVAGAPGAIGSKGQQGAAYVFVKPMSGWRRRMTQTAKLDASDGGNSDELGVSVAISGKTVVAGAFRAIIGGHTDQGAAYLFVKPGTVWRNMTQTAKLTASDGAASNYLGVSASVSGNTAIAGAPGATIGSNMGQGATYVFVKPRRGWANMTQTAKLTASDGAANDQVGNAAAISGNTVVAGTPIATIGSNQKQGAAYVFVAPAGGWRDMIETAKLTSMDGAAGDFFGASVATNGTAVLVGAIATIGVNSRQGAAYEFLKPTSGWKTTNMFDSKLTARDGKARDYFGSSVGISGTTLLVGAPDAAIGAKASQGAGYVFTP